MEGTEFVKTLADSGIATLLAVLVIYWYRVDSKERIEVERKRTEEARAQAVQERDDKLLVVETVKQNTQAMSELRATIKETLRQSRGGST